MNKEQVEAKRPNRRIPNKQTAHPESIELGTTFIESTQDKADFNFADPNYKQVDNPHKIPPPLQTVSPTDILSAIPDYAQNDFTNVSAGEINDSIDEANKPVKLLVTLRKIQRMGFRLGMERTEEKYQLVPGTGQTFVPFKKGIHFITGLEDKPDRQKKLEKILGVDLSTTSLFWETVTFRMEDRINGQIMVIDDTFNGAYTEIIYYAMLASPLVANGLHEYRSGYKDAAEWYIENKESEAEASQKAISNEMEAFEVFNKMSDSRRVQIAKILGMKVWGLSPGVVKVELWSWLKKVDKNNPLINNVGTFLKEASNSDTVIAVKSLIEDAIFYNVFRMNSARDYIYGDEPLGATKEAIVEKLTSPKNASLRAGIQERVNLKS